MIPYPIDLSSEALPGGMYASFQFDHEGIPRYPYASGPEYNIGFICHYALYQYHRYTQGDDDEARELFLRLSDWILTNGNESGGAFTHFYRYAWGDMAPNWVSALGQGRILSVLSRAYDLTRNTEYSDACRQALKLYQIRDFDGGIQGQFPDGKICFEEYPNSRVRTVLNGLITSLFGLGDCERLTNNRDAGNLLLEATDALASNLHRYDVGFWSTYDLSGPIRRLSGNFYHEYACELLHALFTISGEATFSETANRWQSYHPGKKLFIFRNLGRLRTRIERVKSG